MKRQQWEGNFRVKAAASKRVPTVKAHLQKYGIDATVAVETSTDQLGRTIYQVIATYEEN